MDNIPCNPDQSLKYSANTPVTTAESSPPKPRRLGRWILMIVATLILLLFPVIRETYFRCAICGMNHAEQRISGFDWLLSSWEQPTECSEWYQANVEPAHQHVWVRGPYAEGKNCFGGTITMLQSSSLPTGPYIWLPLGRFTQIEIYQKSPTPDLARTLFLKLARFERYDSKERIQQDEIYSRLNQWMDSGLESSWPFKEEEFSTTNQSVIHE